MNTKTTLDPKKLRRATLKLRALNHPTRIAIAILLEAGARTVTGIYFRLRIEQDICSQHLMIMRRQKIVKTRREGKYIYYSLNWDEIERMAPIVRELAEGCELKPSQKRDYDNSFRSMRHY